MTYKVIPLDSSGEGRVTADLESVVVEFVTKYNYSAKCWTLDLYDAQGVAILTGLMLVPDVDVLYPYQDIGEDLGSLVLVEQTEMEYTKVEALGATAQLLWFPPGQEIVLP